jgi:tetratricopeptide (TPR) repeat protein
MRMLKYVAVSLTLLLSLAACDSNEEQAEAAYERGLALVEAGDLDRARIEFRNAVRLDPNMAEAQLQLGRIHMAENSFRPAFRSYRYVIENEPDNVEALLALGRLSFFGKDWESFERYAPRAIEAASDRTEARVLDLASRYRQATLDEETTLRAQLVSEAADLYETAPDDKLLRQLLIDGNLMEGRYEAALDLIEQEIAENPKDRNMYNLKVRLLAEMGDFQSVEDELRRMVEQFPNDTESQALLVRTLMARGKVDEVETYLRERVATAEDDEVEPFSSLIQFLRAQKGPDAAIAELNRMIAEAPDNHMLRMTRAAMLFDIGERSEAIEEMEALSEREAGTEEFTTADKLRYKGILAKMLSTNGNNVGARRLVEEILQEAPNDVAALKLQARWYVEDDDTTSAITALRTALAEEPNDVEALSTMAWAYERAGNTQLMLDFLALAAEASNNGAQESMRFATALLAEGRPDQAESVLQTALRLQPNNPELLTSLGRLYLREGDLPRARQARDALRQIDAPLAQTAAEGIELELIAQEQGTEQALDYLEELASTSDRDDVRAKTAFLSGLLQTGEVERASTYVEDLIAQDPENDAFRYFKAVTLAASGDLENARSDLESLTESNPRILPAWQLLARLQVASGDVDAAVATVDRALESLPQSAELLWAKATYLEGKGDIDGAIAVYEDIYDANSESIIAANNLASLMSTYREDPESFERARVIARRLKDSEIPAFQDTYGWILHRSGETDAALPYLEGAAAGLPNDPVVQTHLGFAYLAQGRREDAEAQLKLAQAASADPLTSPMVRNRVSELEQALAQN